MLKKKKKGCSGKYLQKKSFKSGMKERVSDEKLIIISVAVGGINDHIRFYSQMLCTAAINTSDTTRTRCSRRYFGRDIGRVSRRQMSGDGAYVIIVSTTPEHVYGSLRVAAVRRSTSDGHRRRIDSHDLLISRHVPRHSRPYRPRGFSLVT